MSHFIWFCLVLVAQAYISPADFESLSRAVSAPLFSTAKTMGKSIRHNNLTVYTLSKLNHSDLDQLQGRKAILINSQMHARQPYSVQMLKRIFEKTVTDGTTGALDFFLNQGVFIFYPFVNIDGYHSYVQQEHKPSQIRKNMNGNSSDCIRGSAGVDINRNFPSSFGAVSSSSSPCGEEYRGVHPFSEKQSEVFRVIFEKFRVVVAIDVHSYGNEWIYPYAADATNSKIKNTKIYPLYQKVIKSLRAKNRQIKSCLESLNYIADGVYIDWAVDQGALALAFEVGRTFRSDHDIADEIETALEDFAVVFRNTLSVVQVTKVDGVLMLRSNYLEIVDLVISVGDTHLKVQLQPLAEITIPVTGHQKSILLTVNSEEPIEIALLETSSKPNYSSLIIALVIMWLVLVFFGCYGCSRCKRRRSLPRRNIHFEEIVREDLGAPDQ